MIVFHSRGRRHAAGVAAGCLDAADLLFDTLADPSAATGRRMQILRKPAASPSCRYARKSIPMRRLSYFRLQFLRSAASGFAASFSIITTHDGPKKHRLELLLASDCPGMTPPFVGRHGHRTTGDIIGGSHLSRKCRDRCVPRYLMSPLLPPSTAFSGTSIFHPRLATTVPHGNAGAASGKTP